MDFSHPRNCFFNYKKRVDKLVSGAYNDCINCTTTNGTVKTTKDINVFGRGGQNDTN